MAQKRSVQSLRRRPASRTPFDRVLIVCEGEKTEPNYLREIAREEKLMSVEIRGDGGSAPILVVKRAIELFEQDREFDRVYCVYDKDTHTTYAEANALIARTVLKRRANTGAKEAEFRRIASVPCFEYWLLLHYKYTCAPQRSSADVISELRKFPDFASYEKNQSDSYSKTKSLVDTASKHAKMSRESAESTDTDNPTTHVDVLVEFLLSQRMRSA